LSSESAKRDKSITERVLNNITCELKQKSNKFCDSLKKVLMRGLGHVMKNGIALHKYKSMGISPRILPVKYGEVLYSVKGSLRETIIEFLRAKIKNKAYYLVDFDIKSCFTSILLGLYS